MQQLITIFHVLFSVAIIALVLIQHGKGADVGAAFGSGASNTMFGSQGSTPFLVKITALLAALFFITSVSLSYLSGQQLRNSSDVAEKSLLQTESESQPLTPPAADTNTNNLSSPATPKSQ